MKVWIIRNGAVNAEILDVMTSSDDLGAQEVTEIWQNTFLGQIYKNQFPNACAVQAVHAF